MKTTEGHSLDDEDSAIYSDAEDVDHFFPMKEWPDKALKKKTARSQAPHSDETIKYLLQVHQIHVDILASMGVDACKEYRLSKVENVLSRPTAGTTKCSICCISYYNTQKLKNHIKNKHLKKSSHKCAVCGKYFRDLQSLKVIQRSIHKVVIFMNVSSITKNIQVEVNLISIKKPIRRGSLSVPIAPSHSSIL